jgi:proline iminopeptidase
VSLLFLVGALSVPAISTVAGNGDTTGTIAFAGGKLEYYIQGTGVPCVVYNIPRLYQRLFSTELRKHAKLIFLDSRMSVPTVDSYDWRTVTMDTLVDDIEQLRKILGFEKICVIGHSLNGMIAVEYARKYPEHTSHVVMIGTPPFSKEEDSVSNAFWDSVASNERKQNLKRN